MALSDWTIHKSDMNIKATINSNSSIAGGGSLILSDNGVTESPQCVLLRTLETEKGFLHAKIRTLLRLDTVDNAGVGIVFMLDQEDITETEGNFYGVFIGQTRLDGTNEIVLAKFFDGLQSAPATILYNASYSPVGVCALEVEWESDLGTVGGTHIIVRLSDPDLDIVDFNSLVVYYDDIDETDPLVVSAGEGFAYHSLIESGGSGTNLFTLDKSIMISL